MSACSKICNGAILCIAFLTLLKMFSSAENTQSNSKFYVLTMICKYGKKAKSIFRLLILIYLDLFILFLSYLQIPSGTASVEYAMASGYQRELFIATQMKSSATKQCPYFQSISLMRLHTGMKISFHLFSRERTLLCWKLLHNIYMCFLPITGCRKVL